MAFDPAACKVAFAELPPRVTKPLAADFLRRVLAALPDQVHTVLTDKGTQFSNLPHQGWAWRHIFGRFCAEHGIAYRFTKPALYSPKA